MFSPQLCTQSRSSDYLLTDENKSARRGRGGGRGSRGTYKPRGRSKMIGHSYNSSYSYTNNSNQTFPKVCINPEILRRLGYPITSAPNF